MAVHYDYYRIFYHVAQEHSFTRAAAILENNQPNITRCMNNLEQELGCRLFLRSNRGVILTPEGQRLFAHVQVAYEQLSTGEEELKKSCRLETGLISLNATETALHLFLLRRLADFHTRYPNIRLRITNDTSPQAVTAVAQGRADAAVITTPCQNASSLTVSRLASFREVLVGGSNYRELASKMRRLQDLSALPLVCLSPGTSTRAFYQQLFAKHDLPLHVDMEATAMDQMLPMIQYNLGIGFVPEPLAAPALARQEVFEIRLVEPIPERRIILAESTRPQSIAFQRLKELLYDTEN